ncbi:MAG: D-tyrosyl-tRNA(Tyr) deacylase [Chlamydiae bacterium]|nr:D-tyrosyl-tRNA(Tyr) deacylase [Chlamydiota bacterium]
MKILIQKVSKAEVCVENKVVGKIKKGLLVYIGIHHKDQEEDANFLANKVVDLRLFEDEEGKMNLSLEDVYGEVLVISQFTLYGNGLKGRRPSFIEAAPPEVAKNLYEKFLSALKALIGESRVQQGQFAAHMQVEYINDGPVSLILDKSHLH